MTTIDHYAFIKEDIRSGGSHEVQSKAMQHCAERIWNAISKYVTIDKDGIFKDPDWPHLWDKR